MRIPIQVREGPRSLFLAFVLTRNLLICKEELSELRLPSGFQVDAPIA